MNFDDDTLELRGLEQFARALSQKIPSLKVGVLGSKSARSSKGSANNAEIGAVHEFGSLSRGIPQRSWLRIPLIDNMQKEMDNSGALSKEAMKEVLKQGSLGPWMRKVGVLAESIVMSAFDSAGFGKWAPWSKGYTNNTVQILVDTQQLRNSVTSEVDE